MKPLIAASIMWLVVIGLIVGVSLCVRKQKPMLVEDVTLAASTHCVKPTPSCNEHCIRMITKRNLV